MKTHATKLIAERSSAVAAPLQVVITYDHHVMADGARKLLNGFFTKWASDIDVHRDEWSFAELEHEKFANEALELAAPADIFVIAVTGVNDLPFSFIEWFNAWLKMRNHKETAVILAVASSGVAMAELSTGASMLPLPSGDGLSFFSTTVNLKETSVPASMNPMSLLARLGSICNECLPEDSGLND